MTFFRRYRLPVIAVILIIIISAIVFISINWISHRSIKNLTIEGNQFIPQEIFRKLVPDSLFKREKGKVKLQDIRQIVLQYPFTKNANARFGSNDNVLLELTVRKPIAQLVDSSGKLLFVDEEKKILPYLFFENFSHLPLITCLNVNGSIDTISVSLFVNIIQILRQEKYAILYAQLSELISHREKGNYSARLVDDTKVEFGDSTDIVVKINNLMSYLITAENQIHKIRNEYIDLRWSRQVIVK